MSVAAVLFACCTIWSLNSAIGFASTNIFKSIQPKLVREKITELEFENIEATKGTLAWLKGQSVSKSRSHRKMMVNEVRKTSKELDAKIKDLKARNDLVFDAHPHSTMLADLTGLKREDALMGIAIFFGLLIELVSALGFFALFKTHKKPPPERESETVEDTSGRVNEALRTVETPEETAISPTNDNSAPLMTPETVARHFCETHAWSKRDEPITAQKAHNRYKSACKTLGIPPLSLTAFGVLSSEYVIKRKERGKVTYYPKPVQGAEQHARAA